MYEQHPRYPLITAYITATSFLGLVQALPDFTLLTIGTANQKINQCTFVMTLNYVKGSKYLYIS